jgi:hypothetical protein
MIQKVAGAGVMQGMLQARTKHKPIKCHFEFTSEEL